LSQTLIFGEIFIGFSILFRSTLAAMIGLGLAKFKQEPYSTFGENLMKKSLLALVVLGAFTGAASAQSSVTIYGVADVGLQRTKLDPGESTTGLSSGLQSGSRIGFRGTEDLGGGLSASFALENGYDISNGTMAQGGLLFGRQAWVGLNSSFGSLKFGRQYTPMHIALDTIDPFATGITADGSGIEGLFRPHGVRMNNTLNYSLTAGGISGQLAYGLGEVAGSNSIGRHIGAGLGYANGPINVQFAYQDQNTATGAVDTGNQRTGMLGATYDFGIAKAHAAYADNRDENAAGASTARSRDYMLGVSARVGTAGTVLAAYARRNDRIGSSDADFWQLGYTHSLSKRTNLYTSYSIIKNDGIGAAGGAPAGGDISWLNVGIRHLF
jgi:predicted porin